ncbi:MAG TPA: hypothetical protein VI122_09335 [Thermoleophilaceae bacterium]
MIPSSLTVRQTRLGEPAVEQLAQLDSVKPLTGLVLVAEAEGRPVAAISVDDGRAAADPFLPAPTRWPSRECAPPSSKLA